MNSAGITERIFNFAKSLVGHITGSLGHVNIMASLLFSGMSGSALADAGGLGQLEIKSMRDAKYHDDSRAADSGILHHWSSGAAISTTSHIRCGFQYLYWRIIFSGCDTWFAVLYCLDGDELFYLQKARIYDIA